VRHITHNQGLVCACTAGVPLAEEPCPEDSSADFFDDIERPGYRLPQGTDAGDNNSGSSMNAMRPRLDHNQSPRESHYLIVIEVLPESHSTPYTRVQLDVFTLPEITEDYEQPQ